MNVCTVLIGSSTQLSLTLRTGDAAWFGMTNSLGFKECELTTLQKSTMWFHCSIAVASSLACTASQHCELRRCKRGGAPCPGPDELDADRFFSFAGLPLLHAPEPLVDGITLGFFRGCPLPAGRGVLHT